MEKLPPSVPRWSSPELADKALLADATSNWRRWRIASGHVVKPGSWVRVTMQISLAQLRRVSERAVAAAGPRYTPGIENGAPNISISYLDDVIQALAHSGGFRERLGEVGHDIRHVLDQDRHIIAPRFRGLVRTPQTLLEQLDLTVGANGLEDALAEGGKLRVICRSVSRRVQRSIDESWDRFRQLSKEAQGRGGTR